MQQFYIFLEGDVCELNTNNVQYIETQKDTTSIRY